MSQRSARAARANAAAAAEAEVKPPVKAPAKKRETAAQRKARLASTKAAEVVPKTLGERMGETIERYNGLVEREGELNEELRQVGIAKVAEAGKIELLQAMMAEARPPAEPEAEAAVA